MVTSEPHALLTERFWPDAAPAVDPEKGVSWGAVGRPQRGWGAPGMAHRNS